MTETLNGFSRCGEAHLLQVLCVHTLNIQSDLCFPQTNQRRQHKLLHHHVFSPIHRSSCQEKSGDLPKPKSPVSLLENLLLRELAYCSKIYKKNSHFALSIIKMKEIKEQISKRNPYGPRNSLSLVICGRAFSSKPYQAIY